MKRALVFYCGRPQWGIGVDNDTAIEFPNGERICVEEAVFMPPVAPSGNVFALGLNYANHSTELGFKPPTSPLVFLKGRKSFVAHGGTTPYPPDAEQIHPECELVAVIGKPARKVAEADALQYVSAYSLCCDYAVREYLENYYRPNLIVKNRDATTPIGPWLVDAADIADPQNLNMLTTVNGETVQQGNTRDMVFSIAWLIAWLSDFMTLMPGDLILTGTPHGVKFCAPGDVVVVSIEGVGALRNTLEAYK